jgi:hypothetical protein
LKDGKDLIAELKIIAAPTAATLDDCTSAFLARHVGITTLM